jgi:hypothetical protein
MQGAEFLALQAVRSVNSALSVRKAAAVITTNDLVPKFLETLGRHCAAGTLQARGLVSVGWTNLRATEFGVRRPDGVPGDEIELPPNIWRRPETRRRLMEAPEDGWSPGEISYEEGRVLVLLEERQLRNSTELLIKTAEVEVAEESTLRAVSTARRAGSTSLSDRADRQTRNAEWMRNYATIYKAREGKRIVRNLAVAAIYDAFGKDPTRCTTREAEAAYESLPYEGPLALRNPSPADRSRLRAQAIDQAGTSAL